MLECTSDFVAKAMQSDSSPFISSIVHSDRLIGPAHKNGLPPSAAETRALARQVRGTTAHKVTERVAICVTTPASQFY